MNPGRLSNVQFDIVRDIVSSRRRRFSNIKIFGSRAQGRNRPGSDLDLAVIGADVDLRDELLSAFEESDISISVDVVDFDRCSNEALRSEILQHSIDFFLQYTA